LTIKKASGLFAGLPNKLRVWNSHGDRLIKLPPGFTAIGTTENSPFAAIEDRQRHFYGIQFHPEVFHTERGIEVYKNFLFGVCGAKRNWTMGEFIQRAVEDIRTQVGKSRVILGLSGGVDSSVAAALLHKAIGKQLTCVFVDNGLLRQGERDAVSISTKNIFASISAWPIPAPLFLGKLKGVSDPEKEAQNHRAHIHQGF
jgi:GMP synthase (glutamine-hydrolysing)